MDIKMSGEPLISIVTVSYQAESTIEKTIQSVLNQTYRNIEYIFKDGGSVDATNSIIKRYEKMLHKRGIPTKHIVGADRGVYNAMNQALIHCNGQYVMFLNADDMLYCENVLQDIFSIDFGNDYPEIIYGDVDFVDEALHFLWKGDMSVISKKSPFCHQSSLVKKQWMVERPFDETLQIAADYDLIYKSFTEKAVFFYVNIIVARVNRGGISGRYLVRDRIESRKVKLRYNGGEERSLSKKCQYILILASACVQEILFKILPSKVCTQIRHMNKKRKMKSI